MNWKFLVDSKDLRPTFYDNYIVSYEAKLENPRLISYLGRDVSIKDRLKYEIRPGDVVAP